MSDGNAGCGDDGLEGAIPRRRGGDPECPPGYPFCAGCGEVFEDIDDIDGHTCPDHVDDEEGTRWAP